MTTAQRRQGKLRLVITSATLDGEKFSTYFGDCPVFTIPGRCYDVGILYAAEELTPDQIVQVPCAARI